MHPARFALRLSLCLLVPVLLSACSKTLGWGVLLWYTDEPGIPSGTILPVYVRSNIEQVWIAGVPEAYKTGNEKNQMIEIPLPHLELAKNKKAAEKRAGELGEYALTYAETLQDGLPVRDHPENNARRVYRLKQGEIIKILKKTEGIAAISTTGAPLPGDWLWILTESGATGYCFSYRLRLFEHPGGPLLSADQKIETGDDADLDMILGRTWYPELYSEMITSGAIDLAVLSKNWGFNPGVESGTARIFLSNTDLSFSYTRIRKTGDRTWVFDGSQLEMSLRSESSLSVQYTASGKKQSASFVTLPVTAEVLVNRETERRQALFQELYVRGPSFYSVNYGVLSLNSGGGFQWDGLTGLSRDMVSLSALGSGKVDMGISLSAELQERYNGAMMLRLDTVSGETENLVFLYTLDNQGLRMEYVPYDYRDRGLVTRRDPSAPVIYFTPIN